MTFSRAIDLMNIEKECIVKNDICDHDCANCALAQEDKELLEAYDLVCDVLTAANVIALIPGLLKKKLDEMPAEQQDALEDMFDRITDAFDEELTEWEKEHVQKLDEESLEGSRRDTDGNVE